MPKTLDELIAEADLQLSEEDADWGDKVFSWGRAHGAFNAGDETACYLLMQPMLSAMTDCEAGTEMAAGLEAVTDIAFEAGKRAAARALGFPANLTAFLISETSPGEPWPPALVAALKATTDEPDWSEELIDKLATLLGVADSDNLSRMLPR